MPVRMPMHSVIADGIMSPKFVDWGKMQKKHQFEALDSIRGIAAFVVVIHHLILGFQPDLIDGQSVVVFPLIRMLFNGTFAVDVFFVLSGFVLSHSFVKSGNIEVLRAAAVKRYWRLFIPVTTSIGISYVLLRFGAYANIETAELLGQADTSWLNSWYRFPPSLFLAVREAVYGVFIHYRFDVTYNNVLWTMNTEFIGSFFIFCFHALTSGLRNRPLLYFILALIFHHENQLWMVDFLAGSALCELFHHQFRAPFPIGLLLCGLLAAGVSRTWLDVTFGYPLATAPILKFLPLFGATAVVSSAIWSDRIRSALSISPLLLLGRMSFPLYLIHVPVECSAGCRVYLSIAPELGHTWAFVVASVVTVLISLILAVIGAFTIEPWSISCGKWVYERWFRANKPPSSGPQSSA